MKRYLLVRVAAQGHVEANHLCRSSSRRRHADEPYPFSQDLGRTPLELEDAGVFF